MGGLWREGDVQEISGAPLGASQTCKVCYRDRAWDLRPQRMRWFRSHRDRITWLACFALACQLVLSFGHVHLGKDVHLRKVGDATGIWSVAAGNGTAGENPASPSNKNPAGLADDYCAVCRNISLASALVIPIALAIEAPFSVLQSLPWPVAQAEPTRCEHSCFQARGPPQA
jgi:hypothetical protein